MTDPMTDEEIEYLFDVISDEPRNTIHIIFDKWYELKKTLCDSNSDESFEKDRIMNMLVKECAYFSHYKTIGRNDGIFYHKNGDLYYVREEMNGIIINVVR